MIRLYDYELSGNCYKVRLLLSFLGLVYERVPIDFYPGFEHRTAQFLTINPLGQLPVIDDGNFRLRDAQAILVYLASRYDASATWYPHTDPELSGQISMWMAFADALSATAGSARLHDTMFFPADVTQCRAAAHRQLRVLDEHLWFGEQSQDDWLCSSHHPTIADVACFPYVMLSEEGGISRLPYPAVRRWTDRFRRLPAFTPMPGVFVPASP